MEEILGRSQHAAPFEIETLTRLLFIIEQGRTVERAIDPEAIPLADLEHRFDLVVGLGTEAQTVTKELS